MRLDPQKTFDAAKDKVIETIKETFPIEEGNRTLEVEDVWVEDNKLVDDIRSQKMTKMRGGSWTVPIKGRLKLKDKSTGKTIDRKTIQLGRLPKTTRRFSHIVDGTEYNVTNQWLLRPGVYNRIRQDGSIASEFHTRGKPFRLEFDPKSKKFRMRIGGARPELYPFLRDMGVSDEVLEKQWGKEILEANKKGARTKATDYIYRAYKGELPTSKDEAIEYINNRFENTPLDPSVTKHTLGEAHNNISMKALLQGAQQTLDIARGKREPDVRDALIFKRFNALEDHLANKLKASKRDIHNKTKWNLRRFDDIDRIVPRAAIDKPIKDLFTSSSLTSQPEQVNPVEFLADHLKTTVLGDGGLKTEQEATDALKDIDPTHFGFLDPLATPEGSRTGITLQVAEGVEKDGDTLSTPAWNIKEKRLEHKTISDLYDKVIVLPDQVEIKDGDLKFKSSKVKAFSPKKGPLPDPISPSKADYAYIIPQQLYTTTTNLLPFMSSNTPYRITTAGRQITQAVPLKHREKPLVRAEGFEETVESLWGKPNAHLAPVSGEVTSVQADGIKIKDSDGNIHEVQLYHNFPLNADKSFITSEPKVQKGDKVKKDQVVADTTATKDGVLALGTNLQVAYLPMQGLTYEDAIAVSESAAEKLTSEHLHKKTLTLAKDDILNKKKYQAYYGSLLDKTNVEKLDDDGVIRKGLVVKPGDLLIAGLKNRPPTTETRMLQRLNKSLVRPFSDGGVTWDKEYPGVVTDVVKKGGDVKVFVKTEQPLVVGDKLVGRAGNKAIVAKVLPDAEMPKTKDGTPVDILMNSLGVPGRINMSQILETAAGKVAEKTGKPYLAPAFSDEDIIEKIKKDLKAQGLRDKEPLYDAKTNKLLGDVLVGPQYMLKLKHTVENKSSARGGPGAPYDHNRIPKRGGPDGAQSIGNLGTYALLSRGKDGLATLREAHTWKVDADQADEVWKAIQTGTSLPAPRSTFASRKMMNYIKGMGVDIKKSGNALTLTPMTNKDILAMSAGEIKDPGKMVKAKDPTIPEVGGLFDLKATGGLDGNKWSHLKLPEPMPNPVFERGIRSLLGITDATFSDVVSGKSGIDEVGNIVPMEKAKTLGGPAIKKLLDNLDVNQELKKAQESLKTVRKDELSRAHKKVKYLQALKENNMTPSEAYMTNYIPVLPPQFRPLVVSQDGSIVRDDLNELYKSVGMVAGQLGKAKGRLPEKEISNLRFDLYDGMQALTGIGGHPQLQFRGLIDIIAGKKPDGAGKIGSPKEGFFQKKLIGARQNLSMRSTIVPDPTLSIDEVGLPRQAAMEIYKPFVVNELKKTTGISPLQAQKYIKDDDPMAWEALERVVHERPVWVKRDPVLHRYSVQAFNPKLVDGKVVHIHPLTTSGFNADFDGDQVSAYVPISEEAVQEAYKAMPSRNLFNPASGALMYTPSKEMQTGLYLMTRPGKKRSLKFSALADAEEAVKEGKLDVTDVVNIGKRQTTVGQMRVASALPEPVAKKYLGSILDKKTQKKLFTDVALNHKHDYGNVANKLKDFGNEHIYATGFSLGLDDFKPHKKLRDSYITAAEKMFEKLPKSQQTPEARIELYDKATERMMKKLVTQQSAKDDKLLLLQQSGSKPGPLQYRQITLAPMLVKDPMGKIMESPVKTSFSEGLDLADYWKMSGGARQSVIQSVQSVRDPGYLTKQLMNTTMDHLVTEHDCGTTSGITLDCTEDAVCYDRLLAKPVTVGRSTIPANTILTPEIMSRIQSNGGKKIVVRSPLKCKAKSGICSHCLGLDKEGRLADKGTAIGVTAGQALGERSTQLALRSFHGGGVLPEGGSKEKKQIADNFSRVQQLFTFPKILPKSAPVVEVDGIIKNIQKDPAGGHNVFIESNQAGGSATLKHYIPQDRGEPKLVHQGKSKKLQKGMKVDRGMALSDGPINPHDLLKVTNIDTVQNYLTDELYNLYKNEGIDRRHIELNVRAATDSGLVVDPGDVPGYIRGDHIRLSAVRDENAKTQGKKMRVKPELRGINLLPLDISEDWLARLNHNKLSDTIIEAAQQGWTTRTGGVHPIPALVTGEQFGLGEFY